MKRDLKTIIYNIFMALLAIISIVLIVLDYAHEINIISPPYSIIDNSILIVFAIDYFVRLLY
jgi:voltage-gated potassium channel